MAWKHLVRTLLAVALAASFLAPPAAAQEPSPAGDRGLLAVLWDLVGALFLGEEADNRGTIDPNGGTAGLDSRCGIDPNGQPGCEASNDSRITIDPDG